MRLARRPGMEGLEVRSLMATGFPLDFVGPLPTGGYYDSSVSPGTIYSNYDAPALDTVIDNISSSDPLPSGTVTYSTDVGQFEQLVPDDDGISTVTATSLTVTGSADDVQSQLDNVLLLVPDNYQGNITLTETRTDPAPMTKQIIVPVLPYDDGAYEASLQDLKTVGTDTTDDPPIESPAAPDPTGDGPSNAPPAPAATGVRQGIDWSTLQNLGPGDDRQTPPTLGNIWTVKTVKGSTLNLLEADTTLTQAQIQQGYQDVSTNCHGYTFGMTNVVTSDGKTHNFQLTQDQDVKTLLNDQYTQVSVDQASADAYKKNLYFVFYNQQGQAAHSAVNTAGSGQSYFRSVSTTDGSTVGLGGSTQVNSKNGNDTLSTNTTIKTLMQTYTNTKTVKIYELK